MYVRICVCLTVSLYVSLYRSLCISLCEWLCVFNFNSQKLVHIYSYLFAINMKNEKLFLWKKNVSFVFYYVLNKLYQKYKTTEISFPTFWSQKLEILWVPSTGSRAHYFSQLFQCVLAVLSFEEQHSIVLCFLCLSFVFAYWIA